MAQVTSKVLIFLNGVLRESKTGTTSFTTGGIKRTPVISDNKVVGYTESIESPLIETTFIHTADVSLQDFNDFKGTVTLQTDSGVTWVVQDAWSTGNAKLAKDGEITVTINGVRAEQA
jgi:hypothetical protein